MHTRERYFIQTQGPDDAAVNSLIQKALEIEHRLGNISRIVFVAYGLQNDGWVERQFGRDGVKKLKKGTLFSTKKIPAKFESLKTYQTQSGEIVVALGLRSDDVLKLDDNFDITALLALPWVPTDVEKWSKVTGATELNTGITAIVYPDPPCIVIKALEDLSHSINMSTGISNSSDNDTAKTYLRALAKYDYELNEINIESYLIRECNWNKGHVDDLITIVNKINNGKIFQGGEKTNLKSYVTTWENECR